MGLKSEEGEDVEGSDGAGVRCAKSGVSSRTKPAVERNAHRILISFQRSAREGSGVPGATGSSIVGGSAGGGTTSG